MSRCFRRCAIIARPPVDPWQQPRPLAVRQLGLRANAVSWPLAATSAVLHRLAGPRGDDDRGESEKRRLAGHNHDTKHRTDSDASYYKNTVIGFTVGSFPQGSPCEPNKAASQRSG